MPPTAVWPLAAHHMGRMSDMRQGAESAMSGAPPIRELQVPLPPGGPPVPIPPVPTPPPGPDLPEPPIIDPPGPDSPVPGDPETPPVGDPPSDPPIRMRSARTQGTPVPEVGGYAGPEPTRYGDWEHRGRATDF
jgi:homeobox protein ESX1